MEIASDGASALFSSYLNGVNSGVYNGQSGIWIDSGDGCGQLREYVRGRRIFTARSDFPITISTANPATAFLAKIVPATLPFTFASPTTVNFGTQPVGVSSSIYQRIAYGAIEQFQQYRRDLVADSGFAFHRIL